MAVVQLSQFDITVGQLYHFATGGFWANLPRFCRVLCFLLQICLRSS